MMVRAVLNLVGVVFKVSVGAIKLPRSKGGRETDRGAGSPPPRWED